MQAPKHMPDETWPTQGPVGFGVLVFWNFLEKGWDATDCQDHQAHRIDKHHFFCVVVFVEEDYAGWCYNRFFGPMRCLQLLGTSVRLPASSGSLVVIQVKWLSGGRRCQQDRALGKAWVEQVVCSSGSSW